MRTEDTLRTAQDAARERDEITLKLRGISAVMLAQTGETWPVAGVAHTASTRSRALASVSNAALRTARMKPKRTTLSDDEIHIETVGGHKFGRYV